MEPDSTKLSKLIADLQRSPIYVSSPDAGHGEAGIVINGDPVGGGLILYGAADTYDPELGTGTYQVLMNIADGKFYAGTGNVIVDSSGITISGVGSTNYIIFKDGSSVVGFIRDQTQFGDDHFLMVASQAAVADLNPAIVGLWAIDGGSTGQGRLRIGGSSTPYFVFETDTGSGLVTRFSYFDASPGPTFWIHDGVTVGIGTSSPSSLLHLKSSAPSFRMEDTTASAKSLLVTTDGNSTTMGEASGTAFLTLDLANEVVRVGHGTLVGAAPTGEAFSVRTNPPDTDIDHVANVFVVDWTGTAGHHSVQNLEAWTTLNHASGDAGNVYGIISNIDHRNAGTLDDVLGVDSTMLVRSGSGAFNNLYNYYSGGLNRVGGAGGTVTNVYEFYAETLPAAGITNRWAFYSAGPNDQVYFAGNVGIGSGKSAPAVALDITGAIQATTTLKLGGAASGTITQKVISALANNGVAQVATATAGTQVVIIVCNTTGTSSMFALAGGAHSTGEMSDPYAAYSITAGTAGTNIYWSAGNTRYEIENKTGGAATYTVFEMVS